MLRDLGGSDGESLASLLLVLAVGAGQLSGVDALVKTFLHEAAADVVLFHYDGQVDAWRDLSWAGRAVSIAADKQTKWWFAKRFLHPDVVNSYEHIFIWDEDLDATLGFNTTHYVHLLREHDLHITQPAIQAGPVSWPITRRVPGAVLHRCSREEIAVSPCVEMMAPVFSRRAWACVWFMLQDDLVHAFGVDLAWHVCAPGGFKSMAVIDAEPLKHRGLPTLGGEHAAWVNQRRRAEWAVWNKRWAAAEAS